MTFARRLTILLSFFWALLPAFAQEQADTVLSLARTKDIMPQIVLADRDVIQASHLEHLDRYHMDAYRPLYEKAMTLVPDIC